MDKKYFKNCTPRHIKLYARYDAYTHGENAKLSMNPTLAQAKKYLEEEGNIGDTSLEVLAGTDTHIFFLSIDSNIEVVVAVRKMEFARSTSMELN